MTAPTPDAVAQAREALAYALGWTSDSGWNGLCDSLGINPGHATCGEVADAYRAIVVAAVRAECAAKVDDPEPCDWHQDGMGLWQTDCGNAFEFNEDGPWMNGIKFCGYCGKKLVEVPYEPMPDDDEEAQP